MRKTEVREIDGTKFQVTQLGAMASVKMVPKLAKLFGPSLRRLAEGDVKSLKDLDLGLVVDAVVDLVDRVDGPVIEDLLKTFLADALVDAKGLGEPSVPLMPVFDAVMSGRPFAVFKLLAFAIEVNYQSFFDVLRARAQAAAAEATASSSKE
jgi:hypothetical protein